MKERDLYEKPTKDKLDAAERFKNEGDFVLWDKSIINFRRKCADFKRQL